ncbi:MAG TPA: septum formation initiator family protein [bacterium]|nr:septum formation initiator family protein [bacterium]
MLKRLRLKIEHILPMSLPNLSLFLVLVYFLYIVGRTVLANYHSNAEIKREEDRLVVARQEIAYKTNLIEYYKTNSFKEKEARAKLGYKTAGEKVVSLPLDTPEEKERDSGIVDAPMKIPNYRLWWSYFFEEEGKSRDGEKE